MAEKFSQKIKMIKKETNRTAKKGSINIVTVITIIISKQSHSGKKSATHKKSRRTDLRGTGQRQDNNIHLDTYK